MITTLTLRHLKVFWRNRTRVFLSLMGSLIGFAVFLLFLQHQLQGGFSHLPHAHQFVDLWFIAGMLPMTAITAAFGASQQVVSDDERRLHEDWQMTSLTVWQRNCSYFWATCITAYLLQLLTLAILLAYFYWQDQLVLTATIWGRLAGLTLLNTVLASLISQLVVMFIHHTDSYSRIASMVGACSGFLVGSYIPLSMMPKAVAQVMKLFPPFHATVLYRELMLSTLLDKVPAPMRRATQLMVGTKIKWGTQTLTGQQELAFLAFASVILIVVSLMLSYQQQRKGTI